MQKIEDTTHIDKNKHIEGVDKKEAAFMQKQMECIFSPAIAYF